MERGINLHVSLWTCVCSRCLFSLLAFEIRRIGRALLVLDRFTLKERGKDARFTVFLLHVYFHWWILKFDSRFTLKEWGIHTNTYMFPCVYLRCLFSLHTVLVCCDENASGNTCRIIQKILHSPNRTNRSNRQASTRVPQYREIFLSVANGR